MNIRVEVYESITDHDKGCMHAIKRYLMNHNDPDQRRVLGEQCRNAFEGGQVIVTYPEVI
jgi:hypothetical protein